MRIYLIILFIFCAPIYCEAQSKKDVENRSLCLGMKSRAKADFVLHIFDTVCASKLLYSEEDERFLVIIDNKQSFSEYYIQLNKKGRLKQIRLIDKYEKKNEILNKAFDLNNYTTDFITDKRYLLIAKKYFVILNEKGERYGECSVLSETFVHIDFELSFYLAKRIYDMEDHKKTKE